MLVYQFIYRFDQLLGVTSFGIGCKSIVSGEQIPAVFGSINSVIGWIHREASAGQFCKKPNVLRRVLSWETRNPSCKCGVKKATKFTIDAKITGGTEAEENEFPWAALVLITKRSGATSRCGGSLINER